MTSCATRSAASPGHRSTSAAARQSWQVRAAYTTHLIGLHRTAVTVEVLIVADRAEHVVPRLVVLHFRAFPVPHQHGLHFCAPLYAVGSHRNTAKCARPHQRPAHRRAGVHINHATHCDSAARPHRRFAYNSPSSDSSSRCSRSSIRRNRGGSTVPTALALLHGRPVTQPRRHKRVRRPARHDSTHTRVALLRGGSRVRHRVRRAPSSSSSVGGRKTFAVGSPTRGQRRGSACGWITPVHGRPKRFHGNPVTGRGATAGPRPPARPASPPSQPGPPPPLP